MESVKQGSPCLAIRSKSSIVTFFLNCIL